MSIVVAQPAATAVTLATSVPYVQAATPFTLTANLSSITSFGVITGNVGFSVDGGTPTQVAIANSAASITLTLALGKHTITATFAGNSYYLAGTGTGGAGLSWRVRAPAALVFPGGGYNLLAWDGEGTDACEWLNSLGVTCLLVKYRVPEKGFYPDNPADLEDAQQAMRIARAHAKEWHIASDRIGVVGFSAGANLAVLLSTHPDDRHVESTPAAPDANASWQPLASPSREPRLISTDRSPQALPTPSPLPDRNSPAMSLP